MINIILVSWTKWLPSSLFGRVQFSQVQIYPNFMTSILHTRARWIQAKDPPPKNRVSWNKYFLVEWRIIYCTLIIEQKVVKHWHLFLQPKHAKEFQDPNGGFKKNFNTDPKHTQYETEWRKKGKSSYMSELSYINICKYIRQEDSFFDRLITSFSDHECKIGKRASLFA